MSESRPLAGPCGETRYGFDWGPMKVERWTHVEGRGYSLMVETDHQRVVIYVSEKGRVMGVYPYTDGVEWHGPLDQVEGMD